MSPLKGIAAAGFMMATLQGAEAVQLSDLQGRPNIPDNKKTNCARTALIEEGFGDRGMTQDAFEEDGQMVYHFETWGPNGEETYIDVIQNGPQTVIKIDTDNGNSTPRKTAVQSALMICDKSMQFVR